MLAQRIQLIVGAQHFMVYNSCVNCLYCNKKFNPKNINHRFCSQRCGANYRWNSEREKNNAKRRKVPEKKTCVFCGKDFLSKSSKKKCCSKKCNYNLQNKKTSENRHRLNEKNKHKHCKACGDYFYAENIQRLFCSKYCSNRFYKKGKARKSRKQMPFVKKCVVCGNDFMTTSTAFEFCKDECRVFKKKNNHNRLNKEYKKRNRTKLNLKEKEKLFFDKGFAIKKRISAILRLSINKDRTAKKYFELFGYTLEELICHLEKTYRKNYDEKFFINNLNKDIHIDHIIPVSSFKLINDDNSVNLVELKKCWSLSNLQLLKAEDNLKKNNRLNFILGGVS